MDKLQNNTKDLILVEGIKDVIKLQVLGFDTISTLGNKVSEYQLEQLREYFKDTDANLYILFDGDQAGKEGVLRLIHLVKTKHYYYFLKRIRICLLEENQDPADICSLNNGRSMIEKILYQSVPVYQ